MNKLKLEVISINEDVIATSLPKVTFTIKHVDKTLQSFSVEKGTTWRQWDESTTKYKYGNNGFNNAMICADESGQDTYPYVYFDINDYDGEITSGTYTENENAGA